MRYFILVVLLLLYPIVLFAGPRNNNLLSAIDKQKEEIIYSWEWGDSVIRLENIYRNPKASGDLLFHLVKQGDQYADYLWKIHKLKQLNEVINKIRVNGDFWEKHFSRVTSINGNQIDTIVVNMTIAEDNLGKSWIEKEYIYTLRMLPTHWEWMSDQEYQKWVERLSLFDKEKEILTTKKNQ